MVLCCFGLPAEERRAVGLEPFKGKFNGRRVEKVKPKSIVAHVCFKRPNRANPQNDFDRYSYGLYYLAPVKEKKPEGVEVVGRVCREVNRAYPGEYFTFKDLSGRNMEDAPRIESNRVDSSAPNRLPGRIVNRKWDESYTKRSDKTEPHIFEGQYFQPAASWLRENNADYADFEQHYEVSVGNVRYDTCQFLKSSSPERGDLYSSSPLEVVYVPEGSTDARKRHVQEEGWSHGISLRVVYAPGSLGAEQRDETVDVVGPPEQTGYNVHAGYYINLGHSPETHTIHFGYLGMKLPDNTEIFQASSPEMQATFSRAVKEKAAKVLKTERESREREERIEQELALYQPPDPNDNPADTSA